MNCKPHNVEYNCPGHGCGSKKQQQQQQQPWRLPGDLKHFQRVTSTPPSPGLTNAVIMGRKTWESLPPKFRPLPGRVNVILSRGGKDAVGGLPDVDADGDGAAAPVLVASSLDEAMSVIKSRPDHGATFVIGGGQIYDAAIESGLVRRVVYTNVKGVSESQEYDAFFPELKEGEWDRAPYASADDDGAKDGRIASVGSNEENEDANVCSGGEPAPKKAKVAACEEHVDAKSGLRYEFWDYVKRGAAVERSTEAVASAASDAAAATIPEGPEINPEEMQYLDICRDILENGVKRGDRTGTGTLSKFGVQMRYSLRDGTLPLLTTKRTFWRGVAEELLWFVSGSTNANELSEKDIHIWDGNGSREFLDKRGLTHREEGDLGPVYGFQWRHFGAEYEDMHANYDGRGVDQLAECIDKIKNNPEDRRIVMSAWNPADLDKMALPPCHMFCQFYVSCAYALIGGRSACRKCIYFYNSHSLLFNMCNRSTLRRTSCPAKCTSAPRTWA